MTCFAEQVRIDDCVCTKATEKALLVKVPGEKDPIWIPKSQVDDDSEVWSDEENENTGTLISQWIAEQKGLA